MRKISHRAQKTQKIENSIQINLNSNQQDISSSPMERTDTSAVVFCNSRNEQMKDGILESDKAENSSITQISRRDLPIWAFCVIMVIQGMFTIYPSLIFTKTSGVYQFFLMEFTFPIIFVLISAYLIKDYKRLALIYFMLDPLMIITMCLIATYIFPYFAMNINTTQIFQQIGYAICNIAMIGNYRVLLLHMNWTKSRVVSYKLSKLVWILFYLFFGTYYVLGDISYTKGKANDTDSKVKDLVILFVFSGFALQLEIFNRASDFDKTSQLKLEYMILTQEERQFLKETQQIQIISAKKHQKLDSNTGQLPKATNCTVTNSKFKVISGEKQYQDHHQVSKNAPQVF